MFTSNVCRRTLTDKAGEGVSSVVCQTPRYAVVILPSAWGKADEAILWLCCPLSWQCFLEHHTVPLC